MNTEQADNNPDAGREPARKPEKLNSEKVLDRRVAVRQLDPDQVRRYASEVSELLSSDPDGCVRDRSARALGRGFTPQSNAAESRAELFDVALPALHAALEDADYGVRSSAAETLGRLRSESSIVPLLALVDDGSQKVMLAALDALVEIGSDAAVAPLESKRELTEDRSTRRYMTASIDALKRKRQ